MKTDHTCGPGPCEICHPPKKKKVRFKITDKMRLDFMQKIRFCPCQNNGTMRQAIDAAIRAEAKKRELRRQVETDYDRSKEFVVTPRRLKSPTV